MEKIIVPVILGPTAVGKTSFVLRAAEAFGYGVVSCDSRQVYRHMDIGTAKPSLLERGRVKHWLIDILEPSEPYSAFAFADSALRLIREARESGKKILICGGTGLYYYVMLEGSSRLDEADLELRGRLEAEARERGAAWMHGRLAEVDPEAAAKIHPNNLQRVLRALDIYYRRGLPISSLQKGGRQPEDIDFRAVSINRPRDILYGRINRRVDAMMADGLWDEFLRLRAMGYGERSPGMVCVGYRELFGVERGEASLAAAVELIKRNSRRYAKRQMTWFRNKAACDNVDVTDERGDFLMDWFVKTVIEQQQSYKP
jgi:tRNA dimethylallyltransferase